jgi:hypothetical protein
MSDDSQKPDVRRYRAKDRKEELDRIDSVIPAEDLPDDLAELAAGIVAADDAPILPAADKATPRNTTERYPPVHDDAFQEAKPAPAPLQHPGRKPRRHGDWRHNLIAVLFLLATLGLCGYFTVIWQNPYSALNPLAPPTDFILVTETPDQIAVATYEAGLTLTAIRPTPTPLPTVTSPPPVIALTPTTAPQVRFTLQSPGVSYRPNTNERDCNWASIRGTVSNINDQPIDGYRIRIIDANEPERLDVEAISGTAPDLGPGGYEQLLGSAPRDREYILQLYNRSGVPISEQFLIFTRDSCDENVAVANFVQIPTG